MSTIKVDTVRPVTTDGSLTLQGDSSGSGVTGITIDSSGNVNVSGEVTAATLKPYNIPTASGFQSSTGQTINNASLTKVTFDSEKWDVTPDYASSRFTPSVAGYYQVNAIVKISPPAAGFLTIFKNGNEYKRGLWISSGSLAQMSVSGIVPCNGTSDYIEIYLYQSSGSTVTVQGNGTGTLTWCDFHLLSGY